MIYETIFVTLRPSNWKRLQAKLLEVKAEMEDSFEDDDLIAEITNLEIDVGNRLDRIARGDLQVPQT